MISFPSWLSRIVNREDREAKVAQRSLARDCDFINKARSASVAQIMQRYPNMSRQAALILVSSGNTSLFWADSDDRVEAVEFSGGDLPVIPFEAGASFGLVSVRYRPLPTRTDRDYWVTLIGADGRGGSTFAATEADAEVLLADLRLRGRVAASERMEAASVIRYSAEAAVAISRAERGDSTLPSELSRVSESSQFGNLRERYPNMSAVAARLIVSSNLSSMFASHSEIRVDVLEFEADDLPVWPVDLLGTTGLVLVKCEALGTPAPSAFVVELIGSDGSGWRSTVATELAVESLLCDLRKRGRMAADQRMSAMPAASLLFTSNRV